MKKKFLSLMLALVICLGLALPALAADTESSRLDELGLSLEVPSELIALTRNFTGKEDALAALERSEEYYLEYFKNNSIYFYATPEDRAYEIDVTMSSSDTDYIQNISENQRDSFPKLVADAVSRSGATVGGYDTYEHSQTVFIRLWHSQVLNGMTVYTMQYYTIHDNKAINIKLRSFDSEITAAQKELIKMVVDSVRFDKDAPEPIPEEPETPAALSATPTAATVLINGENVSFDAYNIGGNNYFKLRDLAYALSGTEKQFEVGWSEADNAISLTSALPYTAVGGEMASKGAAAKTPLPTTSKVYLDGAEVAFTAYNIDGNNYFKLRDVGEALSFGVDWDAEAQTIVIDTSKDYTPEAGNNSKQA